MLQHSHLLTIPFPVQNSEGITIARSIEASNVSNTALEEPLLATTGLSGIPKMTKAGSTAAENTPKRTARKRKASQSVTKPRTKKPRKAKVEATTKTIEADSTIIGDGAYSTRARKFVYKQNSSVFIGKSVPKTPETMEYFEKQKKKIEEESYHQITDGSVIVETTDGYGLVMMVKGGMYTSRPGEEKQLREKSEAAFKAFTKAYPPETPEKTDYRHVIALENERKEWTKKGLPWGRLVCFIPVPM